MAAKRVKKTREAKPGELDGIHMLESLQRLFARPESRIDAQKMLEALSKDGQIYAKHLVTSGPMEDKRAAKECQISIERLEKAKAELSQGILALRRL